MSNKLIKLKLTPEKNCFLSIPRSWREDVQQKAWFYFEMMNINNSTRIYLEWSGNCVSNDDYVELSATFANKLGFSNDQTVLINVIDKEIDKANEIIIQPNSEFDWENFRLYSSEIESNFLNQVKIVWSNLIVPIWPRPGICIYLKIHFKDKSQQILRLEAFTELIGVIDEREIKQLQENYDRSFREEIQNSNQQPSESTLASLFKFLPQIKLNSNSKTTIAIESTSESYVIPTLPTNKSNQILNLIDGRQIDSLENINLNKLNTVFVNSNQFQAKHGDRSIGKLTRLLSPQELSTRLELVSKKSSEKNKSDLNEENQYLETVVEINFIDQCMKNSLIACNSLKLQLDLYPFSKVILCSIAQPTKLKVIDSQKVLDLTKQIDNSNLINLPVISNVSFSTFQTIANLDQISSSILSFIKEYCAEHNFLILTKSTLIKLNNYEFTFQPDFNQNDHLVLTDQSTQNNLEIRILNLPKPKLKTSWGVELPRMNLDQILKKTDSYKLSNNDVYKFKNYEIALKQLSDMIDGCFDETSIDSLMNRMVKNKIVLIHGKKGCGKTTLVNNLIDEFNSKHENFSLINLDCAKLKGKRIELFKKNLMNSLNESIYSQPCLLVIENLDILLHKYSNVEQEHKLDLLYNQKVKLILIDLIERYLKESSLIYGIKLFVLVTSRSNDLFENQNLELDIFDKILELKAPSSNCCVQMINHLIRTKLKDYQLSFDQIDFNHLESIMKKELSDYLPLDLNVISDQIIMHSLNNSSNKNEKEIILKIENYLDVLNNYVPFNLRSIKSIKNKNKYRNKRLNDLGGLDDVKERLKQIIFWPIKYPKLFENYPIEPQACVLLYGMPGTGKTFLAQALANEYNINFISIKGPEILSKYIGASEQAIRELFDKANLSKPCILFFDEFDSIVPPRQNNNTDVTDRIVNQILTQMDGIESLQKGIYILAATSRPDMIDPALLRPGRFDVCLECNLPTSKEREKILNLLSDQLNLDEDVDLIEIANQTINYTGSDLNSLIINATNLAINELINLDDELNVQNHDEIEQNLSKLKLNNLHFQLAMQSTSPSFSENEILEYNRIFSKLKSDDAYEKKDINLETKSIFAS